jgi:TolB-like protein/Tfp pilus assembly protein PilF
MMHLPGPTAGWNGAQMRSFFREMRRRNVYRVGAMYAVSGWLLVQIATQVLPIFDVSALAQRLIVLLIVSGFPVALVLSWIYEVTPQGIKRTEDVTPEESITPQTGRKLDFVIIGVLAVAVLVLLWRQQGVPVPSSSRTDNASTTPVHAASTKSIAVLPFANLSEEKANEFFASGIQDEILTKLSKIGALKVISRTSTQHYASAPDNLGEIARQLDVANILEGSVQKAGNSVHINVQLIRAATDEHLWAESYNRTLDDVFGVEGEVAQAVADALNAQLSQAEQQAVSAKPTDNAQAYEAWLHARAVGGAGYSFAASERVLDADLEAARLDPNFAEAWADAAINMSYLYWNARDATRSTAAAVREAAEKARDLRPNAGEGLLAQGFYHYRVERNYPAAIEDFKLALEKMPNDARVRGALFFVHRRLGHWDEAIANARAAIRVDPRNVFNLASLGCEALFYLRRFDEARELLQRALQLNPDEGNIVACLAQIDQSQGRLDAAEQWLAQAPLDVRDVWGYGHVYQLLLRRRFEGAVKFIEPLLPGDDAKFGGPDLQNIVAMGYAQKWAGNRDAAKATFERAVRIYKSRPDVAERTMTGGYENLALAYAGLGDHAEAVETARRAIEIGKNDALQKPAGEVALAQVYAQHGDRDEAIALQPHLLEVPAGALTPELLALDPYWDPIRGDTRFQALAKPAIVSQR